MYEYQISANGFDDNLSFSGHYIILVFDFNTISDHSMLISELKKEYVKYCDLQISFGKKAQEVEETIDDYLIENQSKIFITTAVVKNYEDACDLINGWHISKNKTIRIISKCPKILGKIKDYLS